jgi:MYXO-CTERM domain-containing protein
MRTIPIAFVALLAVAAPAAADDCHSNLMIVLDRSCSMQDPPQPGGTMSKWQLAGAALMKITTKYSGMLDFGLIMFPDQTGMSCVQDGPIYVNVGPGNESKLVTTVTSTMPNGPCVTPIKPAIDQVSTDPLYKQKYTGTGARSFVLFISDGMQTCGGNDNMIATSFGALYANGYPSYIVGFGGATSPAALDQFATAGGVPRALGDAGGRLYYQADNAAELDAALDAIVGEVASAEFSSCPGPPCPDGRCFGPGQTCVSGSCVGGSSGGGDGGSGGGDGGSGGMGGHGASGCNCNFAGTGAFPPIALLFGAIGLVRLRRRR